MGNETTKKNEQFKEDMMQSVIKAFNIKGHKKKMELTDQDTWDVIEEISPNVKYFAVYDGHGVKGREAAEGLKKEIHKKLVSDKKMEMIMMIVMMIIGKGEEIIENLMKMGIE